MGGQASGMPGAASPQNFVNAQKTQAVVEPQQPPQPSTTQLFLKCFQDYTEKRVPALNPNMFRTAQSLPMSKNTPSSFKQVIPNRESMNQKRGSVFKKIDMSVLDFSKIPNYKKTDKEMREILPLLKGNFLTKNLNEVELTKLACAMKPQQYLKKEVLIRYGDVGTNYFILVRGNVKISVPTKGTPANDPELSNKIAFTKYMGAGSGFGELALLYNDKRSATIEAVDNCETYVLDGTIFKTLIIKSSIEKRSRKANFLDQIKLFGK